MVNVIKKINRLKPDRTYEYFDIGTDSNLVDCNDNSLLIPIKNPTLEKILPLKLKQETIDDKFTKNSLSDINEQGLYYISKTTITGLPDNITSPFNLLVLTNGNSFRQILFKEERIYIRDNFSSAWSAALAKPFEGSSSSKAGTKGLVPAPTTEHTSNHFLNANGEWTSLNNIIFTSVDNHTPTFSDGFTSQGMVSITANDSTDGTTKALSVTHGISADNISASGNGKFGSINIGDTEVINSACKGIFSSIETTTNGISIKNNGVEKASIDSDGKLVINNIDDIIIEEKDGAIKVTAGAAHIKGGLLVDKKIYGTGKLVIDNTDDITINENNGVVTAGAAHIKGGLLVDKKIYGTNGVYNAYWNDLADSIVVNKEAEIEAGYCYCLKDNKYVKSSKYLDNGIIGIHSDTYGFKMGDKIGEKQLDCAVAGFVLAYVDKDYLPGTALTCTKGGRLTKIKSKDKQRFPEKVIATYWKDEPAEEWGSDNRKVKVNGRKWVKIK